jgi:hypothetical protein
MEGALEAGFVDVELGEVVSALVATCFLVFHGVIEALSAAGL